MRINVSVTYDPQRGYVASGEGLPTVAALSLSVLHQRVVERVGKDARLVLDRAARHERDLRRAGGSARAADAWPAERRVSFHQQRTCRRICSGPLCAMSRHMRCSKFAAYSITSSARANRVAGISTPSVLAVCRLMTNSNLVGSWTGISAGFSPLRMRPA
jgi:hypothetical protein